MTRSPNQPAAPQPDRQPLTPDGPGGYVSCREVLDFIMAYLDDELTPAQRREFERHLAVCPSCVNYLDSYKAAVKMGRVALKNLDAPAEGTVPEGLIKAIREARLRGA